MLMNFKLFYFLFMVVPILQLIIFQIKKLDIKYPNECLDKFKSNNFLGMIIFVNILVGKLI